MIFSFLHFLSLKSLLGPHSHPVSSVLCLECFPGLLLNWNTVALQGPSHSFRKPCSDISIWCPGQTTTLSEKKVSFLASAPVYQLSDLNRICFTCWGWCCSRCAEHTVPFIGQPSQDLWITDTVTPNHRKDAGRKEGEEPAFIRCLDLPEKGYYSHFTDEYSEMYGG